MSKVLDQIIYPGSDQYSKAELAAPGTIPLALHGEPLTRVVDTAYIMYQVQDLKTQKAFMEDFGMVTAQESDEALYMRGYGSEPYIYEARKGKVSKFLGAGFYVKSGEELRRLAILLNLPIERMNSVGGGKRIRLQDPDGFLVDFVHGRDLVEPLDTRREPMTINLPSQKNRVNQGQRAPLQPSAIERFGHYVLMVSDFQASWKWYRKHLGIIPGDVLCSGEGTPALVFGRLDKGSEPADHHTVVLTSGPDIGCMHSAYETLDYDAIGQGQQFLKLKGWKHFWGIGRHILGSQIFDYWLDPHGFELEHYADGDVFDSRYPTQYHLIDRGGLWAWGNDVPDAMRPKPTLKAVFAFLTGGSEKRKILKELMKAMAFVPRPWLK